MILQITRAWGQDPESGWFYRLPPSLQGKLLALHRIEHEPPRAKAKGRGARRTETDPPDPSRPQTAEEFWGFTPPQIPPRRSR